jgi:hypothetical protein
VTRDELKSLQLTSYTLRSSSHGETDEQANQKPYYYCRNAMRAYTIWGTGQAEIVSETGSHDHPEDKNGRISVTFSGQKKLTSGASSRQSKSQARQNHAPGVPDTHGVGYRLASKTEMKLSNDQIGDKCGYHKRNDPRKQMEMAKKDQVPQSSHGAKAAPLGQKSHKKSHPE